MESGYVIYVPGLGYLADTLMHDPWYVWDEDILQAAVFDTWVSVCMVQKYLCWGYFKGERAVSVAPFPVNLRVRD